MAHLSASIASKALGFNTHIQVIIPHETEAAPVDKVLYLLHGLSDNCTAWINKTRIQQYAEKHSYIVIMPEVQRSFYSDMAHGRQYFTYVSQELPQICEKLFNIRHTREKTFVAGLSMGGYGAVKCGLSRPDFYAACASFSGAVDVKSLFTDRRAEGDHPQYPDSELMAVLGADLVFPDNSDLLYLASQIAKQPVKPRILLTCGHDDFLLKYNHIFEAHLISLGYGHTYLEWPGDHTWDFWEECLPVAFDFFEKGAYK